MFRPVLLASLLTAALAVPAAQAQVAVPRLAIPDASHVLAPPAAPRPLTPQSPVTDFNLGAAAPSAAHVRFTAVRVTGAHVVAADRLAAPFASLRGHEASAAELKAALDAVNALYAKAGYPLGRAYIPAQKMQGGVLVVRVVEGYVQAVIVRSDDDQTRTLVDGIAAGLRADRPLRTATLERAMLLIQDLPGVTVGSKFQDMDPATGGTTLLIGATLKSKSLSFYMDNRANLAGLPFQPYVVGTLNNLMGWGDQIAMTALLSPRQKDYAFYNLGLSRWVGHDGLTMTVNGSWAQALDNRSIAPYDLRSRTSQLSYDARYPLLRATAETLNVDGKVYYTGASYSLQGFNFAKDRLVALQLGSDYLRAFSDDLGLGANVQLTHGLGDPGGTTMGHTRVAATAGFTKLRGEARLAWRPMDRLQLIFKARGQYGSGSLYASEEIAFGGLDYGRGYDTAEISGDSGLGLSIQPEYTIPLNWGQGWSVTPYLLADYAKVYNTQGDGQLNPELLSSGLGARLAMGELMTLSLEMDKPINRIPLYRTNKDPRFYVGLQMGIDQALALIGESP